MQRHTIEYDSTTLAVVEIDEELAEGPIREMVQFWSYWESDLEAEDGDYTKTWLKRLGRFILQNRRLPGKGDEGWYPLDGAHGIEVVEWDTWESEALLMEITIEDQD